MKKHAYIIGVAMALLALASCNKEEVQYYSVLGTVTKTTDSTIIESDDGPRLLVEDHNSLGSTIISNDRIFAYYSLVEKLNPEGIDYVIDIYSFDKLLFKQIIELTEQNDDSIGNDEIYIEGLWLVKDYLNLNFKFYANNQIHYINLVRNQGDIPTDTVELEIRHNSNEDNKSYSAGGFVSFDLKTLQHEVRDSVVLQISAKEYDGHNFEKFVTYKY